MTRREEREHIFKLLFLTEFYKEEELEQQEMMYYEGISDAKQEDLTYIRKQTGDIVVECYMTLENIPRNFKRRSKKIWNRLTGRSMKRQRAGEQTVWGK